MNAVLDQNVNQELLLKLLKQRSSKAMEVLYDQYSSVLFGVIRKMVPEEKKAEEILYQTFTFIWNNYESFYPEQQSICLWMIGIARKLSLKSIPHQSQKNLNELIGRLNESGMSKEKVVMEVVLVHGVKAKQLLHQAGIPERDLKLILHDYLSQMKNAIGNP